MQTLEYFSSVYANGLDRQSPDISPLFFKNFSNLPNTLIIDGTRYSEVLKQAGNKNVELVVCEGQTHNFFSSRGVLDDSEDPPIIVAHSIKVKIS